MAARPLLVSPRIEQPVGPVLEQDLLDFAEDLRRPARRIHRRGRSVSTSGARTSSSRKKQFAQPLVVVLAGVDEDVRRSARRAAG